MPCCWDSGYLETCNVLTTRDAKTSPGIKDFDCDHGHVAKLPHKEVIVVGSSLKTACTVGS